MSSSAIAVALAARAEDYAAVGVDVESIVGRPNSFLSEAFSAKERAFIENANAERRDELAARLWCVKESAAKAFGLDLGALVRGVRITGSEFESGRYRVQIENPRTLETHIAEALAWRRGDFVISACARKRDA